MPPNPSLNRTARRRRHAPSARHQLASSASTPMRAALRWIVGILVFLF
jgi:hypothetical protein